MALKGAGKRELARQIQELEPDAERLRLVGFGPFLASELVSQIRSGSPDITALRANGLDVTMAVEVCTAIAAR